MTYHASDYPFAKILAVHDHGHDEAAAGWAERAFTSAFSESQLTVMIAPSAAADFASIKGNASPDRYGTDLPISSGIFALPAGALVCCSDLARSERPAVDGC